MVRWLSVIAGFGLTWVLLVVLTNELGGPILNHPLGLKIAAFTLTPVWLAGILNINFGKKSQALKGLVAVQNVNNKKLLCFRVESKVWLDEARRIQFESKKINLEADTEN